MVRDLNKKNNKLLYGARLLGHLVHLNAY